MNLKCILGVLVIDNSSAFRYTDGIPLCIPEINIHATKNKKLIANPNCTTAIALMALAPIHKKYGIKRAIISTYQAASGAGAPGMQELKDGSTFYNFISHMDPYYISMHDRYYTFITYVYNELTKITNQTQHNTINYQLS